MTFKDIIRSIVEGDINSITSKIMLDLGETYLEDYSSSTSMWFHTHHETAKDLRDWAKDHPDKTGDVCVYAMIAMIKKMDTVSGVLGESMIRAIDRALDYPIKKMEADSPGKTSITNCPAPIVAHLIFREVEYYHGSRGLDAISALRSTPFLGRSVSMASSDMASAATSREAAEMVDESTKSIDHV